MILKPTQIGRRTFVGNGAFIPDGTVVPDDVLIGVQTSAPKNEQLKSGQTWMGSPPLLLPARERLKGFPESLTFRPSPPRRWARGIVELMRIVLPLAFVIAGGYLIIMEVVPLTEDNGWGWKAANALAIAGCVFGVASFLLVVALKWILTGRYRPRAAPMWTPFVWISEGVTSVYESLAVPNFLDILRGTPMLPWALRLLGARIGKGVFMNTTDLTEFDCVRIGDGAELNAWCGPQTHLFEDRVMKIGRVEIGARVDRRHSQHDSLRHARRRRRVSRPAHAGGQGRTPARRDVLGRLARRAGSRKMNPLEKFVLRWPKCRRCRRPLVFQ